MIFGTTPATRRRDAIAHLQVRVAILRREVATLERRAARRRTHERVDPKAAA